MIATKYTKNIIFALIVVFATELHSMQRVVRAAIGAAQVARSGVRIPGAKTVIRTCKDAKNSEQGFFKELGRDCEKDPHGTVMLCGALVGAPIGACTVAHGCYRDAKERTRLCTVEVLIDHGYTY